VVRYEYRIDKLKRLELPDSPGIYRMISKTGEVLYVGKATSLKSRVNSYFRGKKGRDLRKLEMLAQVWDLRVTDCATPLEAALLESDEIKRLNPPYNVVLKRGRRHLLFYNEDFSSASATQTEEHPLGPFRNSNWIEHLRLLFRSLQQEEFEQIFFNPIAQENLRAGFELFCALQGMQLEEIKSVRALLARGMILLRNYSEPEEEEELVEEVDEEEREPTVEEIAAKFERLHRRAAGEYRRGKSLTRLLNSRIQLQTKAGPRKLVFSRGILGATELPSKLLPWSELAVDDFDRMSILLSELNKYEHVIESL
jgi:DNA polymerase III subunit epsilon